jgi:hypothetical protein
VSSTSSDFLASTHVDALDGVDGEATNGIGTGSIYASPSPGSSDERPLIILLRDKR